MDAVARFVELFNAKDFDGLGDLMAKGYSYAEPMFPDLRDAEAHVTLMREVAEGWPDRSIDVSRRLPGADGAVVDATWSGTPAHGGEATQPSCIFAFEIDTTGKISRLRGYYDLPR